MKTINDEFQYNWLILAILECFDA